MKAKGFTLIELMVVVAIVAILASIAIPSYSQYVKETKLAVVSGPLSSFNLKMGQYYADNRTYANANATACAIPIPTVDNFAFSCTIAGSGVSYTATASSLASSHLGNAGSYEYTIDQDQTKITTVFEGATINQAGWKYK